MAWNTRSKRPRQGGIHVASEAIAKPFHADPAKALVMTCIGRLVVDGHARWRRVDCGDIRLTFNTGETFLLAKTMIIRLA